MCRFCVDFGAVSAQRSIPRAIVRWARSSHAGVPPPAAARPPHRRGRARAAPARGPLHPAGGNDHPGGAAPPAAGSWRERDRGFGCPVGGGRRRRRPAAGPLPVATGLADRRRGGSGRRRDRQGRARPGQPRGATGRRRAGRRPEARGRRGRRCAGRRGFKRRRRTSRAGAAQHRDAGAARDPAGDRSGDGAEDPRLPHEARGLQLGRRARCGLGNRPEAAGPAPGHGRAVNALRSPHLCAAAVCVGIAAANLARLPRAAIALAVGVALVAAATDASRRALVLATALALTGWWWGSARLDALDHSVLLARVGTAERSHLVVTGPARLSPFQMRLPAEVTRFGLLRFHEPVLLELPLGRAPPQGALLEAITTVRLPRPASHGFDERSWLRHQGVHVVLHADRWKLVGHRGGLWGVADRLRAALARSTARGLRGERRGVVEGVVLGDEQALSANLRDRFRASGLYHLLAVSGQNVALVAAGALMLAWLLGIPRWLGQLGALVSIGGYVLAVGPQPSVLRAGVGGALGSLAWLTARSTDRWYFLLLGGLALLAWNPYAVFDAGFQLSFAAVVAIFLLAPRIANWLEGYPLPGFLREPAAVSTACGAATAPILWFRYHAIPLLA